MPQIRVSIYLLYYTRAMLKDFERVSAEESNIRRERMDFERNMALISHDMKEAQRKMDMEVNNRMKVEKQLRDLEDQLHAERSARAQMSSSSQYSNEKITHLEKQIGELNEKLSSEMDKNTKVKNSYAELQQVCSCICSVNMYREPWPSGNTLAW